MKLLLASWALLFAPLSLQGQIYADFTVSTGTPPDTTALGTFRARLDYDKAPRPVAAFIGLATGERPWIDINTGSIQSTPYYDGTIFHRLIHNFVIQGGDILGTGFGGPGFVTQDQFHPDLRHSGRYILSMAKSSLPNSTGSQFFITLAATPSLDDKHSVFGEVITNRELIDNFADATLFPVNGESPTPQINLDSVVISGPSLAGFDLFDPSLRLPHVEATTPVPSYDAEGDIFTLTFPRDELSFYSVSVSSVLSALAPLGYVTSIDSDADYSIGVSGVSQDQYFGRVSKVNYNQVINAPSDLVSTGHKVALTDADGGVMTLDFTSSSAGTWSHSDASSGSFTVTSAQDYAPASGGGTTASNYPSYFPLHSLAVTFDAPAGPQGWTNFDVIMSFHEPLTGWVDGSLTTSGGLTTIKQAFTYTP